MRFEPAGIPWAWYSDPEILRLEQERIFGRSWQYVGHTGQVEKPGDVVVAQAGAIPVLVTRDEAGELHGLLNVCRHRGSIVVDEPGNRKSLQCPYHAWTYGLDGALRAAPRAEREGGIDLAALSLVRLALGRWGPFLFVNPEPGASPLAELLGELPELVASAGIDVDRLRFHHRGAAELAANWKLVCENFLECYHCPVAHPGFSALVDVSPEAYGLEQGRWHSSQLGSVRQNGRGLDVDGNVEHGQFHFLWPNLVLNIYPGRANLSLGPIAPLAPERTGRFLDYFFGEEVEQRWIDELLAFDEQVGREDAALVERAQRGVRAGVVEHGALLPQSERLIVHFQALMAEALAG